MFFLSSTPRTPAEPQPMVPVAEALRWRKLARQREAQIASMLHQRKRLRSYKPRPDGDTPTTLGCEDGSVFVGLVASACLTLGAMLVLGSLVWGLR